MSDYQVQIDDLRSEVRRTASLVLLAIMDGDNKTAADLIRGFDNPRDAWIATATLAVSMVADQDDARRLVRTYAQEGLDDWADRADTDTAKARRILRQALSDGRPHAYV